MVEQQIATRNELRSSGLTDRHLAVAVQSGALIRVRRGYYAHTGTDTALVRAVRVGGRLACVSALRSRGIFGFDTYTHVHLHRSASRLRSPEAAVPLVHRRELRLHWEPLADIGAAADYSVGLIDALSQAVRCQDPWHAVASLDNAMHQGLLTKPGLGEVFSSLPTRFQPLKALVEPKSEAGQESVLRCALRAAGLRVELQVTFEGIGRVDLLVEGCLVIEADSRTAHDGWQLHVRDRDRDIDLARLGLMSLRPGYNRTMFATADVVEAVLALLDASGRFRRSV